MTYIPPPRSNGTIQTTRTKQPWQPGRPFRILVVDGGGIRGVFPAAFLAELERRFLGGKSIAGHFDMIAGTSTGGIIALALAHGLTAQEILDVYVERGERIFPHAGRLAHLWRLVRSAGKPRHDQCLLQDELLRIFGEAHLGDAQSRLVIPSFDGRHGEPVLYKTPHHPDYRKDRHKRMVDVALHTSAAPGYYSGVLDAGYVMMDGGLWANTPVMNALVDALACFDVAREDIRILSIGTGQGTFTTDERSRLGGWLRWRSLRPFLAANRAQSKDSLGQAYLLIGRQNVRRIDIPESDNPIGLDEARRAIRELPRAARAQAEAVGHDLQSVFLSDRVDTYVPFPLFANSQAVHNSA
jgi:patatin-like phospholipase/acyl hydrolase